MLHLTVFSKSHCMLCDKAKAGLAHAVQAARIPAKVRTLNITKPVHERWNDKYQFDIPVGVISWSKMKGPQGTAFKAPPKASDAAQGLRPTHKETTAAVLNQISVDDFEEIEDSYEGEGDELLFMHRVSHDSVVEKLRNAHEALLKQNP